MRRRHHRIYLIALSGFGDEEDVALGAKNISVAVGLHLRQQFRARRRCCGPIRTGFLVENQVGADGHAQAMRGEVKEKRALGQAASPVSRFLTRRTAPLAFSL